VLVVDDNKDAALTLAAALTADGFGVTVAHDGPSALRAAAQYRPDVAVVDIGLPVMDGCELAERLRAIPGGSIQRLLAVSGYGGETAIKRSLQAGFECHWVKPVDYERLRDQLLTGATPKARRGD
jgi:two-component system CheB/CheR fusion protein